MSCQALALAGDARNTDPAWHKSPHHERIAAMAMAESESSDGVLRVRASKGLTPDDFNGFLGMRG
jgi:hypothetical protein